MGTISMTAPDERSLAEAAGGGDRDALGELLDLHRPALIAWIRKQLPRALAAKVSPEDLTQETLLRAIEGFENFTWQGSASLQKWLRVIARHLIWNHYRNRSTSEVSLTLDLPGDSASVSRELRREERWSRLERALETLPPESREVVRLARLEGLRIREIAERLGKSEAAVKSILFRAVRALRETMGDTESFRLPNRWLGTEAGEDEEIPGERS